MMPEKVSTSIFLDNPKLDRLIQKLTPIFDSENPPLADAFRKPFQAALDYSREYNVPLDAKNLATALDRVSSYMILKAASQDKNPIKAFAGRIGLPAIKLAFKDTGNDKDLDLALSLKSKGLVFVAVAKAMVLQYNGPSEALTGLSDKMGAELYEFAKILPQQDRAVMDAVINERIGNPIADAIKQAKNALAQGDGRRAEELFQQALRIASTDLSGGAEAWSGSR